MGLFDVFRRSQPLESSDLRRMGRLEAQVENLTLQWEGYRDEIKRLVARLEKRDQRAAEREAREAAAPSFTQDEPEQDATTARVLARRAAMRGNNGLPE